MCAKDVKMFLLFILLVGGAALHCVLSIVSVDDFCCF